MAKAKSPYQVLKDHRVSLSADERATVHSAKAVWHNGSGGAPSSAVWKARHPTKGTIYVTNTHRLYQTAATLKGAIGKFHRVVKHTA